MSKPIASFKFTTDGLKVTFTDTSANAPTSWAWNFGNSTTSADQNPPEVTYTSAGVYTVSLAATNGEGTDTFSFEILVQTTPSLNLTIKEMVMGSIPAGLALDPLLFDQDTKKWQLYLQALLSSPYTVSDENVFNEARWNTLVNVLIAKLIVRDLIMKAAQNAMIAFSSAQGAYNQRISQVTSSTMLVADYSIAFDISTIFDNNQTVNILLTNVNGIDYGPSGTLSTPQALLTYLNGLQLGIFAFSSSNLISQANSNILTTFNYEILPEGGGSAIGGANGNFIQSNVRIVPVSTVSSVSGSSSSGTKGPLKSLETGPSKAEWYDSSTFWSSMFKGWGSLSSSGINSGGMIQAIQDECCIMARRVKISLPFCPTINKTTLFQIGRKC